MNIEGKKFVGVDTSGEKPDFSKSMEMIDEKQDVDLKYEELSESFWTNFRETVKDWKLDKEGGFEKGHNKKVDRWLEGVQKRFRDLRSEAVANSVARHGKYDSFADGLDILADRAGRLSDLDKFPDENNDQAVIAEIRPRMEEGGRYFREVCEKLFPDIKLPTNQTEWKARIEELGQDTQDLLPPVNTFSSVVEIYKENGDLSLLLKNIDIIIANNSMHGNYGQVDIREEALGVSDKSAAVATAKVIYELGLLSDAAESFFGQMESSL